MTSATEALRKITLFKGTILVSFVYAVISVLLLFTIRYTQIGAEFAQETNFPFAITFTIGMLVVIGILIYKVSTFKEEQTVVKLYDNMTCPEFWKLDKTDQTTLNTFTNETRGFMTYKCKKPTNAAAITIDTSNANTAEKQLAEAERIMYQTTALVNNEPEKTNVKCDEFYPKYMSHVDMRENPGPQNSMRCAYADKCGLTWSSVCPDK